MKLKLSLLVILITMGSVQAQNSEKPIIDSVRGVQTFDSAMKLYQNSQYEQSIERFEEAARFFGEEYVVAHAKSLEWVGYAHLRLSENDKMIESFKNAELYARAALEKYGDYKPIISNQLMLSIMLQKFNRDQEALVYFHQLEDLILQSEPNPMYMSLIYQNRAVIAQRNGKLELLPAYLKKAIAFAEKSGNNKQLISTLSTSEGYFYELGNFEKARQLSDKVIELASVEFASDGSTLAMYLSSRAALDFARQEFEMAMNWIDRAINISIDTSSYLSANAGYNYYIKANLFLNLKNYKKAIEFYDLSLDYYNNHSLHLNFIVAALDGKLRSISFSEDKPQIPLLIEEVKVQMGRGEIRKLTRANAWLSIAFGYRAIGDFKMAITYLNRVIQMVDEDDKGTSVPHYLAFYEYSKLELARDNTSRALSLIDKAIEANTRQIGDETYFISKQSDAEMLIHKALILQSEYKNEQALSVLEIGFDRVQKDRAVVVGSEYSMESISLLRNAALDLCYLLFDETADRKYLKKAFKIGELTKSQQLIQWVSESINVKSGRLDSVLFDRRKDLINDISTLERLMISGHISDTTRQYTDSLFSRKKKLYDLSQEIKQQYPKFYSSIYDKMNADLDNTLKSLNQNQRLLSYYLTEKEAYLLVIGQEVNFMKIDRVGLDKEVELFRSMLMNPSADTLKKVSTRLYERLIPSGYIFDNKELYIIPDGALAYLPFELLSERTGQYLMEKNVIAYKYSANAVTNRAEDLSSSGFIAFAPNFSRASTVNLVLRDELSNLPGALEEVEAINQIHAGTVFSDSLATETNFRKYAQGKRLIHLATHAIVDDELPEQSKLVFDTYGDSKNDGNLYINEIYNLDLNAQLITLSACNTGFGKIRKGEGVMSLSRAFAYAGVPATVVSLWPASDKSTPELMKHFYQNLKDGQAKDEALNNARKQYLATAKGKARHPFYWGGFVLIGDNSPVVKNRPVWLWIIPFMLLALILSVLYLRKTKSFKALG